MEDLLDWPRGSPLLRGSGPRGYWSSLTNVVPGYVDPGRGGYWSSLILWSTAMQVRAGGVLVLAYELHPNSLSPHGRFPAMGRGVLVLAYTALGPRLPGDGSRGYWSSLTSTAH